MVASTYFVLVSSPSVEIAFACFEAKLVSISVIQLEID